MRFSVTYLPQYQKLMRTLNQIATVAYTLKNESLQNLLGYDSYQTDAILAEEVTLLLRDREAQEPNWFTPLKGYTPRMLAEVIMPALRCFTAHTETPDQILGRVLNILAVEVDALSVRKGRDKVLEFVRRSDPTVKVPDLEPEDACL